MSEKIWTIEDEEDLRNAQLRLQDLKRQKDASIVRVFDRVDKFVDLKVTGHALGLRELVDWIMAQRWELVDILTEGEYAKLLQFRTIATEQAAND